MGRPPLQNNEFEFHISICKSIFSAFYIKMSVFPIRNSVFTLKIGMYLFCILFFNSVLIIVGTGILYYLEYGVKGLPPRWY